MSTRAELTGPTGRYEITTVGGEEVRTFIPDPLPPSPPIALGGRIQRRLGKAQVALGRLDGVWTLLPDRELFLYSYVRKEAVLSSRIEGVQASLSDLLLFEIDELPGASPGDVVELSNYVAALDHGLARMRAGFPLSNRLIREMHGVLLSSGRGSHGDPGSFRRSQNWIGGSRPGNAAFVPPAPHHLADCMSAFERFLHDDGGGLPEVIRAGLAHVQLETIHPFLDGNGRIGRILIPLMLIHAGILAEPLLYLSVYFRAHRARYYGLLDGVRRKGDWEGWLEFFLEGVHKTAAEAVASTQRLSAMFEGDRRRIAEQGRRAGSALRVHDALKRRALSTLPRLADTTGLSYPAVSSGMELLVRLGIAREITGRRRNRVYAYDRWLAALREGTEVLSTGGR
jgi:cell filamentation protein, protein adenylyltransferase